MSRDLFQNLRRYIREFEDRKISAAILSREIHYAARELADPSEATLRRSLEQHGNRVLGLVELSITEPVHPRVLKVVDELESELVRWGY
jgi:hypothetical protein